MSQCQPGVGLATGGGFVADTQMAPEPDTVPLTRSTQCPPLGQSEVVAQGWPQEGVNSPAQTGVALTIPVGHVEHGEVPVTFQTPPIQVKFIGPTTTNPGEMHCGRSVVGSQGHPGMGLRGSST